MADLLAYARDVWHGDASLRPYYAGALRADGLCEVAEGVWTWPATGNVHLFSTSDGVVLFDTGDRHGSERLFSALRDRTSMPVVTAIYSHGHVDHVSGTGPFDAEARRRGAAPMSVVAHEAVVARFDRYRLTAGYNALVNQRQFRAPGITWPTVFRHPDRTYATRTRLRVGELNIDLTHGRGETDDATVAWLSERRILCCGDFYAWNAPNAGNPQKVQRHVREWAETLRWMAGLGAELLLPGHGVPIAGADRIAETLSGAATVLETLHDAVVARMNDGATLDEILHADLITEKLADLLSRPYLRATYDEPEFIVHNVWRAYGGWYEGDPASIKPAPRADLAAEIADLAGGPGRLADRARELLRDGQPRLAGHLAELAGLSAPELVEVQAVRAEVFGQLEKEATSLMARGIFGWAAAESQARADGSDPWSTMRAGRWAP